MSRSNIQLNQAGAPVSSSNPIPVVALPPASATSGTAAAILAVDAAPDRVTTFTYLDSGSAVDRRISTATTSSAALALSYTDTYAYAGSAGGYYISTVTRS